MGRLRWLALACLGAGFASGAASAQAAVTIGPDPLPKRTGVATHGGATIFTNDVVPGVALSSPIDGVVVRWRVRRGSGGGVMPADTITLRILRGTGIANEFTAVGTSESHEVPGGNIDPIDIYEYSTRLPISTGDRIGLGSTASALPYHEETGAVYLVRINALADGEAGAFEEATGIFSSTYALVNADIEPDCDGDGFGDETQDPEISQIAACGSVSPPPPVTDTTAPLGSNLRFHPRRFRPARKGNARSAKTSASRKRVPRTSRVTYRLNEDARVRFVVKRWRFGRLKGKRCVFGKQAKQLPDAKRCKKLIRIKGRLVDAGKQGADSFRFGGYVGGKPLGPGRYRLVGVPIDAASNRGKSFRAPFAIVR